MSSIPILSVNSEWFTLMKDNYGVVKQYKTMAEKSFIKYPSPNLNRNAEMRVEAQNQLVKHWNNRAFTRSYVHVCMSSLSYN